MYPRLCSKMQWTKSAQRRIQFQFWILREHSNMCSVLIAHTWKFMTLYAWTCEYWTAFFFLQNITILIAGQITSKHFIHQKWWFNAVWNCNFVFRQENDYCWCFVLTCRFIIIHTNKSCLGFGNGFGSFAFEILGVCDNKEHR